MWFSTAVARSSTIVGLQGQGLLYCWPSIVWKVESGPGPVSWEVCFITAEETFCFPFSKDFQHSLCPIIAPIHKNRKLKWTMMEHRKVLLWLWCLLMIVVHGEGYWEDNPHIHKNKVFFVKTVIQIVHTVTLYCVRHVLDGNRNHDNLQFKRLFLGLFVRSKFSVYTCWCVVSLTVGVTLLSSLVKYLDQRPNTHTSQRLHTHQKATIQP